MLSHDVTMLRFMRAAAPVLLLASSAFAGPLGCSDPSGIKETADVESTSFLASYGLSDSPFDSETAASPLWAVEAPYSVVFGPSEEIAAEAVQVAYGMCPETVVIDDKDRYVFDGSCQGDWLYEGHVEYWTTDSGSTCFGSVELRATDQDGVAKYAESTGQRCESYSGGEGSFAADSYVEGDVWSIEFGALGAHSMTGEAIDWSGSEDDAWSYAVKGDVFTTIGTFEADFTWEFGPLVDPVTGQSRTCRLGAVGVVTHGGESVSAAAELDSTESGCENACLLYTLGDASYSAC